MALPGDGSAPPVVETLAEATGLGPDVALAATASVAGLGAAEVAPSQPATNAKANSGRRANLQIIETLRERAMAHAASSPGAARFSRLLGRVGHRLTRAGREGPCRSGERADEFVHISEVVVGLPQIESVSHGVVMVGVGVLVRHAQTSRGAAAPV